MADEERYDYTGVHGFVFIREVDPGVHVREVISSIRALGRPRVFFASEIVGSSIGFAHVRGETLAELQDLIFGDLWERGVHCEHAVERSTAVQNARKIGAKRSSPEAIGLSRVRVQRGALQDVVDAMADEEGPLRTSFRGASIVFGAFDILLQLGGDTFEAVADAAAGPLQSIDGVVATDTAFTDARP